jgi:deazaflavin-dependent oxidoreductase (nitroreductase family)
VDRVTLRVSHGQVMASAMTAGIPVLTVVTTGARTGRRRTAPLIGVPVGEDIAVIGTHFGQTHTPGWYHNMLANPAVEVTYRDTTVAAVAREAGPGERQTIWDQAAAVYAGYQVYQRRITGRDIHVMILEAAPASPEPGRPTSAG